MYSAVTAVLANLILAIVLTPIFEAFGAKRGSDETSSDDYVEEAALVPEQGKEALG
jgi:hypothetical protein